MACAGDPPELKEYMKLYEEAARVSEDRKLSGALGDAYAMGARDVLKVMAGHSKICEKAYRKGYEDGYMEGIRGNHGNDDRSG